MKWTPLLECGFCMIIELNRTKVYIHIKCFSFWHECAASKLQNNHSDKFVVVFFYLQKKKIQSIRCTKFISMQWVKWLLSHFWHFSSRFKAKFVCKFLITMFDFDVSFQMVMAMTRVTHQNVDDHAQILTHGNWKNWSEHSQPATIQMCSCVKRWLCVWISKKAVLR